MIRWDDAVDDAARASGRDKVTGRWLAAAILGLGLIVGGPALASHPVDDRPLDFNRLRAQRESFNQATTRAHRANIGRVVPRFSAQTLRGDGLTDQSFRGKMALFVFADTKCPCVTAINDRVKELARRYPNDLRVAYVFSMPGETPRQIARYMHERNVNFPAIVDSSQHLLRLFDAAASSEMFLLDARGALRYQGRLDDSTFDPRAVKSPDLENAIRAIRANRPVARPQVAAIGCAIPRVR